MWIKLKSTHNNIIDLSSIMLVHLSNDITESYLEYKNKGTQDVKRIAYNTRHEAEAEFKIIMTYLVREEGEICG